MLHLALDPAHHRRPAPALGLAGDGVAGQLRPAGFTLQLLVGPEPGGVELARREHRPDGTARLRFVAAVAESAAARGTLHVLEGAPEAVAVEEAQLPHPGRVDDEALRQWDELSTGRRVAAASVVLADPRGRQQLASGEGVDEGRLADPRGADEGHGPTRGEGGADDLEALAGDRGDGDHVDARRD